jgi:hypothetical protein
MSVIQNEHSQSAEVEREQQQSNTAYEQPNTQLVMTCRGLSTSVEVSPELADWLNEKCLDLDVCALSILVGCAEFVMQSE